MMSYIATQEEIDENRYENFLQAERDFRARGECLEPLYPVYEKEGPDGVLERLNVVLTFPPDPGSGIK